MLIAVMMLVGEQPARAGQYAETLADALHPGLRGCDPTESPLVAGSELCLSWFASNRSGTMHGDLLPGCSSNLARGPDLDPSTELSVFMARGTVQELAFHLGCALRLPVHAAPDVAGLPVSSMQWQGILGSPEVRPFTTADGTQVVLQVDFTNNRILLAANKSGQR